jgi:hypothetical protein
MVRSVMSDLDAKGPSLLFDSGNNDRRRCAWDRFKMAPLPKDTPESDINDKSQTDCRGRFDKKIDIAEAQGGSHQIFREVEAGGGRHVVLLLLGLERSGVHTRQRPFQMLPIP